MLVAIFPCTFDGLVIVRQRVPEQTGVLVATWAQIGVSGVIPKQGEEEIRTGMGE